MKCIMLLFRVSMNFPLYISLLACISDFIATHHRKPYVLDIGCGTGLLSLQAARAGAQRVYACEMFAGWAEIATKNVIANGYQDVIKVFNKHSSTLTVRPSGKENDGTYGRVV